MQAQPTKLTEQAFRNSWDEVRRFGHEEVRVEHIALGLLALQEGGAATALDVIGASRDAIRAALQAALPPRQREEPAGEYPYHAQAVDLLNRLFFRFREGGDERISTADVLLAILDREESPAAAAFGAGAVNLAELSDALRANRHDPD